MMPSRLLASAVSTKPRNASSSDNGANTPMAKTVPHHNGDCRPVTNERVSRSRLYPGTSRCIKANSPASKPASTSPARTDAAQLGGGCANCSVSARNPPRSAASHTITINGTCTSSVDRSISGASSPVPTICALNASAPSNFTASQNAATCSAMITSAMGTNASNAPPGPHAVIAR